MNIPPRKILLYHPHKEERGKIAIMLTRFGHSVLFAKGLKSQEISPDDHDLIIVNEYLSYGSGLVFLHNFSETNRAKTLFLSSGSDEERELCRDSMGIFECMENPVKPIEIAVVVCDFFISRISEENQLVSFDCQ